MDAHAEKIHSIMNLILNKPSLFIFTMLFDFFSALFSTISSVRLALFTQNVIEGKYIEEFDIVSHSCFCGLFISCTSE